MNSNDIPAPPVTVVESEVACTRCGYSLRGLQVTGNRPKCGACSDKEPRGLAPGRRLDGHSCRHT